MRILLALLVLSALSQDPPPKAARSVHLFWSAPDGSDFYHELRVQESVPGSYFMACGWNTGYFGIQELANKDKLVLFSVWDPTKGDDAKAVPLEQRVEVLYSDPEVKVGRFGGEGTGGQAKLKTTWSIGERCRFLVRAEVDDRKTAYTGWFRSDTVREWKKLVTFRVTTGGRPLKGYYSFVEDFRRDGKSVDERRSALFGPGWVKSVKGEWIPIAQGRFSADGTKLDTIDASISPRGFTLATGGATTQTRKLGTVLSLEDPTRVLPADLP